VPTRSALAVGLGQSVDIHRADAIGVGSGRFVAANEGAYQLVETVEIDRRDFSDEPRARGFIEVVPPAKQALLAMLGESSDERWVGCHGRDAIPRGFNQNSRERPS
jgi:hypothetical protein